MNFAQMLAMDVKPLPDMPSEKRSWRDPTVMHEARHTTAVRKYRMAVGPNWSRTVDIAERMGMGRMSIFKQLVRYAELGILERRPLDGKPYNHHTGWEWRVK